jgi:hypothetical protein
MRAIGIANNLPILFISTNLQHLIDKLCIFLEETPL